MRDGNHMKLTVNVVPQITGMIQRKPIDMKSSESWSYLWKDMPLADSLPTEKHTSTIDILIGNDYYLDLIL